MELLVCIHVSELLRARDFVCFAGYQIKHPLEVDVWVKVQTVKATTPEDAMRDCCDRLKAEIDTMETSFTVRAAWTFIHLLPSFSPYYLPFSCVVQTSWETYRGPVE